MISRPRTPDEIITPWIASYEGNWNAMQEALTAEWLIEQGLMPDPSEFYLLRANGGLASWCVREDGWQCQDKRK